MKRAVQTLIFTISLVSVNTLKSIEEFKNEMNEKFKYHEKPQFLQNVFKRNLNGKTNSLSEQNILQSKYYPGGQILTNEPIIGILTQPYIDLPESATDYSSSLEGTIIPSTHVEFLQQAGAKVIPLNYKLRPNALGKLLQQVNGVYIPGDQDFNLKNKKYMDAVETIMDYAIEQRMGTKEHFPVMAISYGFIATLIELDGKDSYIQQVPSDLINDMECLSFRGTPELSSYIYDGFTLQQITKKYADLKFLNEMSKGIYLKNFVKDKKLTKYLNPIAVYDQPRIQIENEIVAIVEGTTIPYFGIAFSIDLIQTNIDMALQARLEIPNKDTIREAQRIANLFVDEARFNGNKFTKTKDEQGMLIGNYVDNLMMINMASPSGDFSKYFAMAYVF